MTPLIIVSIVLAWFALSVGICVAVCVMSSRFTAREERRADFGSGARRVPLLVRESGPSPDRIHVM